MAVDTQQELILCDCKDPEHQWIVSWDVIVDDYFWDEMYITAHLPKLSFWRRCAYAIRYILGFQSKTGAFADMVLREHQVKTLRNACNSYLKKSKEFKEKPAK